MAEETARERDETAFQISMLGGFQMSGGGITLSDSTSRTRQTWNLLEYLVAFRGKEVSQEDMIGALWPDDDIDNPSNALKNLVYRIRTMLSQSGFPNGKDLVLFKRGTYSLNKDYSFYVDTEEFERLYREASSENLETEERIARYLKAADLYKGDFLPRSGGEEWAVPLSAYYHSLFLKCVYEAVGLLEEDGRYDKVVSLCERAAMIDQFEEGIHEHLILSLVKLGNQNRALIHYKYVTDLFYRELGVDPSPTISNLYREIIKSVNTVEMDLLTIKRDLREAEQIKGAFVCEYEVFKNMYRVEARSCVRSGRSIFIALTTITDPDGLTPEASVIQESMEQLLDAARNSLRIGDVIARFSATQYVMMLPGVTFENGEMVLKRIIKRFRLCRLGKYVKVNTKLQPLDPVG